MVKTTDWKIVIAQLKITCMWAVIAETYWLECRRQRNILRATEEAWKNKYPWSKSIATNSKM